MPEMRSVVCACLYCGSVFYVKPAQIKAGEGKYCSRTCSNRRQAVPLEERFHRQYQKRGPQECWPWTGAKSGTGYGAIGMPSGRGGRERIVQLKAHRLAWEIANGRPVPDGLNILHSCDHPWCVNPAHLRPGTIRDNSDDKVSRKRHPHGDTHWTRLMPERVPLGSARPIAKLDEYTVACIRSLDLSKRGAKLAVSRILGVSHGTIGRIVSRQTWRHV